MYLGCTAMRVYLTVVDSNVELDCLQEPQRRHRVHANGTVIVGYQ